MYQGPVGIRDRALLRGLERVRRNRNFAAPYAAGKAQSDWLHSGELPASVFYMPALRISLKSAMLSRKMSTTIIADVTHQMQIAWITASSR